MKKSLLKILCSAVAAASLASCASIPEPSEKKDNLLRELKEETGLELELERLAAIHENFFRDAEGTLYHELSLFFLVKVDKKLASLESGHPTTGGPDGEVLEWLDLSDCADKQIFPDFFKTVDFSREKGVRHFVTESSERKVATDLKKA